MPSTIERILAALAAALRGNLCGASFERNIAVTVEVPRAGLTILHDGEPGEPEVSLSPLTYHYEHVAELDIVVQGAERDRMFDAIRVAVGSVIDADRTLGGLCDWIEARAPRPTDLQVPGAAPFKAATIQLVLFFATQDPLR